MIRCSEQLILVIVLLSAIQAPVIIQLSTILVIFLTLSVQQQIFLIIHRQACTGSPLSGTAPTPHAQLHTQLMHKVSLAWQHFFSFLALSFMSIFLFTLLKPNSGSCSVSHLCILPLFEKRPARQDLPA